MLKQSEQEYGLDKFCEGGPHGRHPHPFQLPKNTMTEECAMGSWKSKIVFSHYSHPMKRRAQHSTLALLVRKAAKHLDTLDMEKITDVKTWSTQTNRRLQTITPVHDAPAIHTHHHHTT